MFQTILGYFSCPATFIKVTLDSV